MIDIRVPDWPVFEDGKTVLCATGWYWAGPVAIPYYGDSSKAAAKEIAEDVSKWATEHCPRCK